MSKEFENIDVENEIRSFFSGKIKEYRKLRGISQEILASYLGLTRTSIVNIEAGRQMPPIEKMWVICCALACTPSDLLPPITQSQVIYEEKETTVFERVERKVKIKVPVKIVTHE